MEDKPGIVNESFSLEISKDWFPPRVRKPDDTEGIVSDIMLFGQVTVEYDPESLYEKIKREHDEHFNNLKPLEDYTLEEFTELIKSTYGSR